MSCSAIPERLRVFVAGLKYVALLDGPMTSSEQELILRAVNDMWRQELSDPNVASAVWRLVEQSGFDGKSYAALLAAMKKQPQLAARLLYHAVQLCAADYRLADEECKWLVGLVQFASLPAGALPLRLLQFFREPDEQESLSRRAALDRLGLPASTSEQVIRARYLELCLKHHPDRYSNASDFVQREQVAAFKRIKEAFDRLTATNQRAVFCRSATEQTLTSASAKLVVGCFHCVTTLRMPADDDAFKSARCPNCKALLAHSRELAETMLEIAGDRTPATRKPERSPHSTPSPPAQTGDRDAWKTRLPQSISIFAAVCLLAVAFWSLSPAPPKSQPQSPTRTKPHPPQLDNLLLSVSLKQGKWQSLETDVQTRLMKLRALETELLNVQAKLVGLNHQPAILADRIGDSEARLQQHQILYSKAQEAFDQWRSLTPDIDAAATKAADRDAEAHRQQSLAELDAAFHARQALRQRSGARPPDQAEIQSRHIKQRRVAIEADQIRTSTYRKTQDRLNLQQQALHHATEAHKRKCDNERSLLRSYSIRLQTLPSEVVGCEQACKALPQKIQEARLEHNKALVAAKAARHALIATKQELESASSGVASR